MRITKNKKKRGGHITHLRERVQARKPVVNAYAWIATGLRVQASDWFTSQDQATGLRVKIKHSDLPLVPLHPMQADLDLLITSCFANAWNTIPHTDREPTPVTDVRRRRRKRTLESTGRRHGLGIKSARDRRNIT